VSNIALELKSHRGMSGLDAIVGDWLDLMRRIDRQCFYHHPYWFKAYLNASPEAGNRIVFACIYRASRLVAVFPTVWGREGNYGPMVVELPAGEVLILADCAISDDEDNREIYDYFRRSLKAITGVGWDVYRARDILKDGHLGKAVSRRRLNRTVYTEKLCGELSIGDYDDAIKNLKKKFRGNLNNAKNKLKRAGEARFEVERSADGVRRRFDDFVELEMSGWKGDRDNPRSGYQRPSAIGLKERKLNFYKSMIDQFAQAGCAEINSLVLNDKLIGGLVCVLLNDTSYLLKVTYDEDAGQYSPGHLLLDFVYRRYAEEGRIKRCNLITDFRWIEGWNPTYREYVVFRDFNTTISGAIACLRSKVGARARDYYSNQH
jgi:CelD/BcsL family acetyltransferase involved in cellulose biosynthesis